MRALEMLRLAAPDRLVHPLAASLELLVGEVDLAPGRSERGAGGEAEHLLEAPVAAQDLPLAAEGDADHDVVEQRLLLGEHALQLLFRTALLGPVLDDPHRALERVVRVDRSAVGARPEGAAVLAPAQLDAARGLAARERLVALHRLLRVLQVAIEDGGRPAVHLAGRVAVHLLVAAVVSRGALW